MDKKLFIHWNTLTIEEWDRYFNRLPRSNFLQSYPYAQAIRYSKQMGARWGLIEWDGKPAGLVQMHELSIFKGLFHIIAIDRGPLWFKAPTKEQWTTFWTEINRQFPARFGRRRRVLPEMMDGSESITLLETCDFSKNETMPHYATLWLDLSLDKEALRQKLKQKWRNTLNKAEKQSVKIEIDDQATSFFELSRNYAADRAKKKYPGPKVKLLRALHRFFMPRHEMVILNARFNHEIIASLLLIIHGQSATYQIGWTNAQGREKAAHNLLLWEAMLYLKSRDIRSFDLGGINEKDAAGVTRFKEGTGAMKTTLAGSYK